MSENGTEKLSPEKRKELAEKTIRKYANLIFRTAYQFLKNYHDAEDILQEVGLTLLRSDAPFDDDRHMRNWLVAVTLNKCKNLRRCAWFRFTEPINDDIAVTEPKSFEVMEELWKLSDNQRSVLYLYFYEQFTIDEIAQILGRSRNTVASWLRRGKLNLKKILTQGGNENV